MKKVLIFFSLMIFIGLSYGVEIYNLDGQRVECEDLLYNQNYVLMFWTTTCPYCFKQFKEICDNQISEQRDINFLFVNLGENKKTIKNFLEKNNFYNCLKDSIFIDYSQRLSMRYNILGVPTFIFIKNKKEVYRSYYINNKLVDYVFEGRKTRD